MASSATKTGNIGVPFAAIVTTSASTGQASVSFPVGRFTSAPVVVASAVNTAGDGRDIIVTLIGAPTASGCTVMARKTRTLPASITTLTVLQGYDPLAPVSIQVHIMARTAS